MRWSGCRGAGGKLFYKRLLKDGLLRIMYVGRVDGVYVGIQIESSSHYEIKRLRIQIYP